MKLPVLFSLAALFLAGCARTLVPHTAYIPLIRDRGQAEIRVSTGFNGSELQAGYAITDHLVLHTALLNYGRSTANNNFHSADLGLGYYYNSPNGLWRLGGHAGLTYGAGSSGGNGCFECPAPDSLSSTSAYAVRYTYAYVQPTVLLLEDNQRTWGFGLRLGQVYYHRFKEMRTLRISGETQAVDYTGRTLAFVQPTFQYSYRASRWLAFSGTFGAQDFLGHSADTDNMNPFVGQIGVHLLVNRPTKSQP